MSNRQGDAEAIIAAALASSKPSELDPDKRYVVLDPDGGVEIIEPQPDAHRLAPRRIIGLSSVDDVASLQALWEKYADPAVSEVFADAQSSKFTAVFDADAPEGASFRGHRAELVCALTPAWKAWLAFDNKLLDQQHFAEHIEDRIVDITEPTGAEMLEIAQTFQATVRADFKQASPLGSGARQFTFEETIGAKAGETGRFEIPASFIVTLQPYENGPAWPIVARFRYRLREGHLQLGYKLERPEDVLRVAFTERVTEVENQLGIKPLLGRPPAAR